MLAITNKAKACFGTRSCQIDARRHGAYRSDAETRNEIKRNGPSGHYRTWQWKTDAERCDASRPDADTTFEIEGSGAQWRQKTRRLETDDERRDVSRPYADKRCSRVERLGRIRHDARKSTSVATPIVPTLINIPNKAKRRLGTPYDITLPSQRRASRDSCTNLFLAQTKPNLT
jgi:hypothetical protein